VLVVLAAESYAALRAASFGGAEVASSIARRREGGDAGEPSFLADGPRVIVLADPGDERVGEWLIDGCSVLPRGASSAQIAAARRRRATGLVATPPPSPPTRCATSGSASGAACRRASTR
jgi:hypothetical protein